MKKKNLLLTLLSLITVVSLAFPAVTAAFAEDSSAANPRMLTVEIFNGGEDGVELAGATFAKEDGASVVSMETGAWADGKIMLIEPQDLSAAREEGKLYYEYKTTGTTSWGKIGIVTFANYWNEGAYVGDGDSIGVSENYTIKSFDLSAFTAEQLVKFKGFAIGTSANFVFKRIWVEYPNPDYVEPAGGIELITEEELANVGANQGGNVTVTVSENKELTLVPKDGAGKDVFGKYTARLTKLSKKKLTRALFNDGTVTFDYKTTDATAFELRLMNDGNGVEWGEYNFSVVPVEITADGEWHTATVNLTDLYGAAVYSVWAQDAAPVENTIFDTDAITAVGFGFTSGTVVIRNIKASYEEKRTVTGIEVGGEVKTEYTPGEKFDATGAVVKIVFSDGYTLDCYGYVYENSELTADTKKVTFSWTYNGEAYTCDVEVTVASEYTSIRISEQPAKTTYKAGEKFAAEGMKVVALKKDETEEEVTGFTCYAGMIEEGMTEITVEYAGLKASVAITVTNFEYGLSITEKLFAKDGEPNYGWTAQVASAKFVSQANYDAASDEDKAKMLVTPKDAVKGYYVSAEFTSYGYPTRAYENGVADFALGELYTEPDYNGTVAITYRTSDTFDKPVQFGLLNLYVTEGYNIGYHCVDITSLIVSDGEWHTLYVDIGEFGGVTDGTGWGTLDKEVDLNKIAGFAIKSASAAHFDIADVSVKWDGDKDAAKAVDTTAPEFTYSGEMTLNFKVGDAAPSFGDEKAYDKNDGDVKVIVEWSDGAVTDGKLNEGTHNVKLYAKDAAGNQSEPYEITVNVTKGETPPEPENPSEDTDKGCKGSIDGADIAGFAVVGAIISACLVIKRKREN